MVGQVFIDLDRQEVTELFGLTYFLDLLVFVPEARTRTIFKKTEMLQISTKDFKLRHMGEVLVCRFGAIKVDY